MLTVMRVHRGNAGWHRITDCGLDGHLYVRVERVDGALRATEFYVDGQGTPFSMNWLRSLPLRQIEETCEWLAETYPQEDWEDARPGPDLSRLATWYDATISSTAAGKNWVYDSFLSQTSAKLPDGRRVPKGPPRKFEDHSKTLEDPTLAPPTEGLTDEFLAEVAEAYRRAVTKRLPPAKALAELAGVSPRTVHDWVSKARKRGIMPPAASRGRVV